MAPHVYADQVRRRIERTLGPFCGCVSLALLLGGCAGDTGGPAAGSMLPLTVRANAPAIGTTLEIEGMYVTTGSGGRIVGDLRLCGKLNSGLLPEKSVCAIIDRELTEGLVIKSGVEGTYRLYLNGSPFPTGTPYEFTMTSQSQQGTRSSTVTGVTSNPKSGIQISFTVIHQAMDNAAVLPAAMLAASVLATRDPAGDEALRDEATCAATSLKACESRGGFVSYVYVAEIRGANGELLVAAKCEAVCKHDQGGGI